MTEAGSAESSLKRFQDSLRALFQFENADLDFGIYRILGYKRKEVEDFIDRRLPQIVDAAFGEYAAADREKTQNVLEALKRKICEEISENAFNEEGRLRKEFEGTNLGKQWSLAIERLKTSQVGEDIKGRIYNDLFAFFRRYYDDGDFVPKPRSARSEPYSIPYSGEEVLLHWANHDQIYVKTGDRFRAYTFKANEHCITFELRNHQEEQGEQANLAAQDENRYIVLSHDHMKQDERSFVAVFEWRSLSDDEENRYTKIDKKKLQDAINADSASTILETLKDSSLKAKLAEPVDKNGRSLLLKHLASFTRRNTSDFFIHKDLQKFLLEELEFYIKHECLMLDELLAGQDTLALQVQRGQVLRRVGEAIIEFVSDVEDLQLAMFKKKKFVIRTDYCLTLNRLPEGLLTEVLQNKEQIKEWKQYYGLDESLGKRKSLDETFFKENGTLPIDTRHFGHDFKWRLLSYFEDLDDALDGVLIRSDSYHALSLILEKYRHEVKCIYIDPPYNTGSDEFLYKDNYRHSSWLSMLEDRLALARELLPLSGTIGVSIDNNEIEHLLKLLDLLFNHRRAIVTVKRGSVTGHKVINPGVVNIAEYLVIYSVGGPDWKPNKVYKERQRDKRYGTYIVNRDQPHSRWKFISLLDAFADFKGMPKTKLKKVLGEDYENELERFVLDNAQSVMRTAALDPDKISKEANELRKKSKNNPGTIYKLSRQNGLEDWYVVGGEHILFYADRLVTVGSRLIHGELLTDMWDDTLPNDLHNEGGVTLKKGKKPEKLVARLIELGTTKGEFVADFFAGTGTACAAAQKLGRKWIGIDMAEFFDSKMVRRLKNTLFGEQSGISPTTNWKGGGFFKYCTLEQYEDTLNNIDLARAAVGKLASEKFGDEYFQKHMLRFETADSPALLNVDSLKKPFNYDLKVQEEEGTRTVSVDLIETFNYLLGIHVRRMREFQDDKRLYRAVLGEKSGKVVAILWRETEDLETNENALKKDKKFIEDELLPALLGKAKPDRFLANTPCLAIAPGEVAAEPIEPEFKRCLSLRDKEWRK